MKKLLLALVLAVSVAGCAGTLSTIQGGIDAVGNVLTPINQPITKEVLNDFENGMIIAFAGLNAYKGACQRGTIGGNCRQTVANLQTYTRRVPAALARVRDFVKNNDQVNALQAYTELKALYNEFVGVAQANGVKTS